MSVKTQPIPSSLHRGGEPLTRRRFLFRGVTALASVSCAQNLGATDRPDSHRVPIGEAFDAVMQEYMTPRKIPGGALAVLKDGRLVYARGYGTADRSEDEPVEPDSLFRIASIAKPLTAVAAFKLIESGKLELNAPVLDLLNLKPLPGGRIDQRFTEVTVRHCLQHTGGWDRSKSGDPMFRSREIARAARVHSPARQESIIRYMLGRPLDFDPGTRYEYSNFGYCLMGRVIEAVAQLSYDQFVRSQVLEPSGIRGMRLGRSLEPDRAEHEVRYYTARGSRGRSVFSEDAVQVPLPYGTFCLEAMDAHGGWLASVLDLARFIAALSPGGTILREDSRSAIYAPPPAPVSRTKEGSLAETYYSCGWAVRPIKSGLANYWHVGSLPGTYTLLVRRWDGLSWVALFNLRPEDPDLPDSSIDPALHRAAARVSDWPSTDLFSTHS